MTKINEGSGDEETPPPPPPTSGIDKIMKGTAKAVVPKKSSTTKTSVPGASVSTALEELNERLGQSIRDNMRLRPKQDYIFNEPPTRLNDDVNMKGPTLPQALFMSQLPPKAVAFSGIPSSSSSRKVITPVATLGKLRTPLGRPPMPPPPSPPGQEVFITREELLQDFKDCTINDNSEAERIRDIHSRLTEKLVNMNAPTESLTKRETLTKLRSVCDILQDELDMLGIDEDTFLNRGAPVPERGPRSRSRPRAKSKSPKPPPPAPRQIIGSKSVPKKPPVKPKSKPKSNTITTKKALMLKNAYRAPNANAPPPPKPRKKKNVLSPTTTTTTMDDSSTMNDNDSKSKSLWQSAVQKFKPRTTSVSSSPRHPNFYFSQPSTSSAQKYFDMQMQKGRAAPPSSPNTRSKQRSPKSKSNKSKSKDAQTEIGTKELS